MKYACNTCGARYAIPDSRVSAAGEDGLRVRCSRCRAIMAVCQTDSGEEGDEDITAPLWRRRKARSRTVSVDPVLQALPTEVGMPAASPVPAALSPSGIYRPMPGVERGVTGVHLPRAGAAGPGREWYAAFGGRPRGPFSRAELELLAEQGRVRSSTLVWRPGFESWCRVRADGHGGDAELAWLRAVVIARKSRERAAADKAARAHGIHRLHLEDFSAQPKTPPPIPTEDDGTARRQVLFVGRSLPQAFAADRVFGAPQLGEPRAASGEILRAHRRHHALAFTAGALLAALGLVLVSYTLPALDLSLPRLLALVDASLSR